MCLIHYLTNTLPNYNTFIGETIVNGVTTKMNPNSEA